MPIERVQQWVGGSLAFTSIEHLAAGLALFAIWMDVERPGARIGLLVMSGICGLVAVAVFRLILRVNPVSPWLVLALVWPLVGAYVSFWR